MPICIANQIAKKTPNFLPILVPFWSHFGQGLSPQDAQGGPSVAGSARRGAAALPGTEGRSYRGAAGAA